MSSLRGINARVSAIGGEVSTISKFVKRGFIGFPFLSRISKCKCGPEIVPVSPVKPITSPRLTG